MKTKKVVINFVGVSMAVAVQNKGHAGAPATPSVPGVPAIPVVPKRDASPSH
jgi:hypothetical protein